MYFPFVFLYLSIFLKLDMCHGMNAAQDNLLLPTVLYTIFTKVILSSTLGKDQCQFGQWALSDSSLEVLRR